MLKKFIGPLMVIAAIFLVYIMVKSKPRPESKSEPVKDSVPVLVKAVQPINQTLQLTAEGFVKPRWQTTLSSEVSGAVVQVNDGLLRGNGFAKGDVLLSVDPINYQAQLSRAIANRQAAESTLIEQKKQAKRAENDWYKLNPNREPDDFNLRIPQVKAAKASLQAAQQDVKLAQENLDKTQIKAPFDGFVMSRNIDLGEVVQVGTVIAELASQEQLEIQVSLDTTAAELLFQGDYQNIVLFNPNQPEQQWSAEQIRFDAFVDTDSRWRSITIEITPGDQPPVIGTFLQVVIETIHKEPLVVVPESALSFDGRIWHVDDNLTAFIKPQVVYQDGGNLYLNATKNLDYPLNVIISPPNSLVSGTVVEPTQWNAAE